MKNIALTIIIIMGIAFGSFAQQKGGGIFQRGADGEQTRENNGPVLPQGHAWNTDANGENGSPSGSSVVALVGHGAAYFVAKWREKE